MCRARTAWSGSRWTLATTAAASSPVSNRSAPIRRRSRAVRRCSSSTSSQRRSAASCPKACCSTSATPTGSRRSSPFPNGKFPMAPASDSPAIELRDLAKSYGAVHAVRGISLDVRRGEIFGFLGLNGAGKTTTIRMLLDLLRPTRGAAALFGIDCQRRGREARAQVGYAPGELGLYPDMTGGQLLDLMASLSGARVDAAYRLKLLDRLELARTDLDRTLREFSTGMKRKLALVQALQADAPLLILDEPTE